MIKKKIFIATGGTGGHIFPACSLAKSLIQSNYDVTIITDTRGFNFLKTFKFLNIIKNQFISSNKKNLFKYLISIFTIITSIIRSTILLLTNRPAIIFLGWEATLHFRYVLQRLF